MPLKSAALVKAARTPSAWSVSVSWNEASARKRGRLRSTSASDPDESSPSSSAPMPPAPASVPVKSLSGPSGSTTAMAREPSRYGSSTAS